MRDGLLALGYNVWMDVDQMSGSTLDAMAAAVENAAVVLICYSEKYKDSQNCRTGMLYTCISRGEGSLGVKLGTHVRKRFSNLDSLRVVTAGANGTLFKF
jgi:hypothetical protein